MNPGCRKLLSAHILTLSKNRPPFPVVPGNEGTVSFFNSISGYCSFIKRRVEGVEILRVQPVGGQAERFTETLVMHNLPCTQEFDRVADIRVIAHTQNVVIGGARFLFCGQILMQVGDGVALGLDISRCPRHTAGRYRIDARGMIDIIRRKAGIHDLLAAKIARKLMHDRADHLQMIEFLRAYRGHSIYHFRRIAARLVAFLHISH